MGLGSIPSLDALSRSISLSVSGIGPPPHLSRSSWVNRRFSSMSRACRPLRYQFQARSNIQTPISFSTERQSGNSRRCLTAFLHFPSRTLSVESAIDVSPCQKTWTEFLVRIGARVQRTVISRTILRVFFLLRFELVLGDSHLSLFPVLILPKLVSGRSVRTDDGNVRSAGGNPIFHCEAPVDRVHN